MDRVAERIFDLVDKQFSEQKAFAESINETPSKVSQWRMGITRSYTKKLTKIAEVLNTSVEYLLTGEKKEPATVSGDGQAEKLAKALESIGIDVDKLSEAEISRIARLAKAALEE